jgi:hypothetical protein
VEEAAVWEKSAALGWMLRITEKRHGIISRNTEIRNYSAGMGGMAEPTPQNMTPAEFKRRVESNGAKTAPVTAAMKRADEKKHAAYRKEMDTFLDRAYASDKTFVQGSRNARKANRANKRIHRR